MHLLLVTVGGQLVGWHLLAGQSGMRDGATRCSKVLESQNWPPSKLALEEP